MHKSGEGLLVILSGPSGVGKGAICSALIERNERIRMSVSATTRAPRAGEIDGVNYFFRSKADFEQMIDRGEFLEYMNVFGTNYYGTPKAYVEEERASGHDIILEIDVKGGKNVMQAADDAISIFIAPPSMSALKTRLIGRGTESADAVERRFAQAFKELNEIGSYHYVVVNDVLDIAVASVESILAAERLRVSRNEDVIRNFKEV